MLYAGAWSARENRPNEWLQVEFQWLYRVDTVITRGRPGVDHEQWVTIYNFAHSLDGINFEPPSGPHQVRVNSENVQFVTDLAVPQFGRFFRVLPLMWHNHISMRVEFRGCRISKLL